MLFLAFILFSIGQSSKIRSDVIEAVRVITLLILILTGIASGVMMLIWQQAQRGRTVPGNDSARVGQ
jgi:hypothetical protein